MPRKSVEETERSPLKKQFSSPLLPSSLRCEVASGLSRKLPEISQPYCFVMKALIKEIANKLLLRLGARVISSKEYEALTNSPFHRLPLLELLIGRLRDGSDRPLFLVQVGANDGEVDDEFADIIADYSLNAMLIEPLPSCFEKLQAKYGDRPEIILENAAIGDGSGTTVIYKFDRDVENSYELTVFASFDKSHLERFKRELSLEAKIEEISPRIASVRELLEENRVEDCDILAVDAEGVDDEIVYTTVKEGVLPSMIVYEYINLSLERRHRISEFLAEHGYTEFHLYGEMNSIAIRNRYLPAPKTSSSSPAS